MICDKCGQRVRVSLAEKNRRISEGMKNSISLGRKRKFDYEVIRQMHEDGMQISEIALMIGASVASVSKIVNSGSNR